MWTEGSIMTPKRILHQGKSAVWPPPDSCRWQNGSLQLQDPLTISCDASLVPETELFRQGMTELGITVQLSDRNAVISARIVNDDGIGREGYLLEVLPSGIILAANTVTGIFYAFQTLAQLISNSAGRNIPLVNVTDSPFKQMRGVHLYVPSKANLPWFRHFLDFLAKFKFNAIFMEMGASMKFDRHPEINLAWESFCREMLIYPGGPDSNYWGDNGMQMRAGNIKNSVHIENGGGSCIEKHEMAEIVQRCGERHIEIIPEVQGLSHAYWMLLAHKDCAERSDDPYPDTWCPSNPESYEIYFACLQEIIDVIKPATVSLGHDEYYSIGLCGRCREKTGHDLFAGDILKCHAWLAERGIGTHVWADKFYNHVKKDEVEIGMGSGGGKHLNYNLRTGTNELVKPTYRALDRMPCDILLSDWYYSLGPLTQDMFGDRGLSLLFGNFNPAHFKDMEARLRRPNVIGAEVSIWHETSDMGMSMTDNLTKYLTAVNILWNKDYDFRACDQYNRVIAQIYPYERDKMNGLTPPSAVSERFSAIDLSAYFNSPMNRGSDFSCFIQEDRIPNTIPFDLRIPVGGRQTESAGLTDSACQTETATQTGSARQNDNAYLLVGREEQEQATIAMNGSFRSIAFLHSYTAVLPGPSAHACTYVGWEEDTVGSYAIGYADGTTEKVRLEYARNIYANGTAYPFGAHRANPAYQHRVLTEHVEKLSTSKKLVMEETNFTLFCYEWVNPHPEKQIKSITVCHQPEKTGSIALFSITGIK